MATAAINNPAFSLRQVTADIAESVARLKGQNFSETQANAAEAQGQTAAKTQLILDGYAVSYLAPQSAYAVQSFVSEDAEISKRQGNVYKDTQEALTEEQSRAANEDNLVSFREELLSLQANADYAGAARAYAFGAGFSENQVLSVSGAGYTEGSFSYATAAYDYVFSLNRKPDILIDYMHEYNRDFDFKV